MAAPARTFVVKTCQRCVAGIQAHRYDSVLIWLRWWSYDGDDLNVSPFAELLFGRCDPVLISWRWCYGEVTA